MIAIEKRRRNYDLETRGRQMLATLVRVPGTDGTFIELETLIPDDADGYSQTSESTKVT